MTNYLNEVDLPSEIKDGIKSRSSMLSATLQTIDEEDLIQEGLLLVYQILAEKPDAPIPYIMKAINNHYADLQNEEIERKTGVCKNNKNLGFSGFVSLSSDNVQRKLDDKTYKTFQKQQKKTISSSKNLDHLLAGEGRGVIDPIIILIDQGYSYKEIAALLGKDPKTIRKILKQYGKPKKENVNL